MSTYPSLSSGELLTASKLRAMQWNAIIKSINQDSTADTTTFTDDLELVIPLEANATYYCSFYLGVGGTSSAGPHFSHINTEYSFPSGSSAFKFAMGPAFPGDATSDRENTTMVSAVHGLATDRRYGTVSLTSVAAAIEHIRITTSSTSGNLTFRFTIGTNTTAAGEVARILAGSFCTWVRVA